MKDMKEKETIRMRELFQEWGHITKTDPDLLGISFERFLINKIIVIEDWFRDRERSMKRMERELNKVNEALKNLPVNGDVSGLTVCAACDLPHCEKCNYPIKDGLCSHCYPDKTFRVENL
jgi:hypothetical protein